MTPDESNTLRRAIGEERIPPQLAQIVDTYRLVWERVLAIKGRPLPEAYLIQATVDYLRSMEIPAIETVPEKIDKRSRAYREMQKV